MLCASVTYAGNACPDRDVAQGWVGMAEACSFTALLTNCVSEVGYKVMWRLKQTDK